jgi:hypothetical protein
LKRIGALAYLFAAFSESSEASGGDMLASLVAQFAIVILCVVVGCILVRSWLHRGMLVLCVFVGVLASWLLTWNWPYSENQSLITAIEVGLPLLFTGIAVSYFRYEKTK